MTNNNENVKVFKVSKDVELIKKVPRENIYKWHETICNDLKELFRRKNNDYGTVFEDTFADYGLLAPIARFRDKMGRIESLMQTKQLVEDESILDTILDLGNYCILTASILKCIEEYKEQEKSKIIINEPNE